MATFAELDSVLPKVAEVKAGGEVITVCPLGLRKLKAALPHVALIAYILADVEKQRAAGGAAELDLTGLLVHGGDSVFELLSIATGKPVEWFDDLDPFEGADLLLAVVEVNLDFFVNWQQRLKPLKARAAGLLSAVATKSSC